MTTKPITTPAETDRSARIDTLNQIFALFRLNYHSQFFKAFTTDQELSHIKKLWLEELADYSPSVQLAATKVILETAEFLPTLASMRRHCQAISQQLALPDAHSAYLEACRAPSPKAAYTWSHPAVYYAGQACDWYFLHTSSEQIAYPIFKQKYQALCDRLYAGETLNPPQAPALAAEPASAPLSQSAQQAHLAALRQALELD
jgi:hypothetical protein